MSDTIISTSSKKNERGDAKTNLHAGPLRAQVPGDVEAWLEYDFLRPVGAARRDGEDLCAFSVRITGCV